MRGVDLLALALLMATLSDWLVICHRIVPRVVRFGESIPAVTIRFEITKQDMRKGRRTGWPVSGLLISRRFSCSGKLGGMIMEQWTNRDGV